VLGGDLGAGGDLPRLVVGQLEHPAQPRIQRRRVDRGPAHAVVLLAEPDVLRTQLLDLPGKGLGELGVGVPVSGQAGELLLHTLHVSAYRTPSVAAEHYIEPGA
jgi:hypothetical protein